MEFYYEWNKDRNSLFQGSLSLIPIPRPSPQMTRRIQFASTFDQSPGKIDQRILIQNQDPGLVNNHTQMKTRNNNIYTYLPSPATVGLNPIKQGSSQLKSMKQGNTCPNKERPRTRQHP
ncbi:hypothetical protein F8M41_008288 [Gigaspora margarita]|uniref:Uncharacterized protein n=1 Tax=Gigaspora margarita TaxID=4874 RepID=A0A8H4A3V5_GIGMA|nr:hypothetical protein F8M41_008288 [Gigaspora margarita]